VVGSRQRHTNKARNHVTGRSLCRFFAKEIHPTCK